MTKALKLPDYKNIVMVLQGGGALGSYQAGVLEGLMEAKVMPNWLAGISIGALNCAIIAGNAPGKRVEKLRGFWETICSPPSVPSNTFDLFINMFGDHAKVMRDMTKEHSERLFGSFAAAQTVLEGQNGFFTPRPMAPGTGTPSGISFYDTTPLIKTLEEYADFDRINNGDIRVSIGATNVRSGNFVYFDNTEMRLRPEHFMASGALPPGFPAVEIDSEFYWDGGCVSNTPLDYILHDKPRKDTLIFQVDLWSAVGKLPTDIFEVLEREKDIRYSSRTRGVTNYISELQKMRQTMWEIIDRIPPSVRKKDPWFDELAQSLYGARYNCIHMIYKNKPTAGHYKDFEFSHEAMVHHWKTGLNDLRRTLEHPKCLDMPAQGENFVTYDVHRHQ